MSPVLDPVRDGAGAPAPAGPRGAPRRAPDARVLMVSPRHFDVVYSINPHMVDAEGRLRRPDRAAAADAWDRLRKAYESIGYPVQVLDAVEGLPDMVFAANQSFPFWRPDGRPAVILSRMRYPERAPEVEVFEGWYRSAGYEVFRLPGDPPPFLEGHGDLLWFPGRRFLFGGHGFRTDREALDAVARITGAEVLPLRLRKPGFYHLDTCLAPLDGRRALVVPDAFEPEDLEFLGRCFERLLPAPPEESATRLAANAHCPDGRNVLIDAGARETIRLLKEEGFRVLPIDTSEFLKAGGSVFCLKTMLPA